MPKHQDSLYRQWHMLRLVPRYPLKISAQHLQQQLLAAGFEVTERTVQRDLQDLSSIFPLTVDDREKPFGWSWQKDAANFDLPGLTIPEALTLVLAEQHLKGMLPASIVDQLAHYFISAHQRLDSEPRPHRGRSWLDKVRTVPPAQPLLVPVIDQSVQYAVTDALLHEKQLSIRYKKKRDGALVDYRIHPLALIQRGSVAYLYVRVSDHEDTRTLAVHRIVAADVLDAPVRYPKEFNIDRTIDQGIWGFGSGEKTDVVLIFRDGTGDHLLETPLSANQKVVVQPDGRLHVSACVANTPQLKWWLMGFGDSVEVVSPQHLRCQILESAESIVSTYTKAR